MKDVLITMIAIYHPKEDWMGFQISKKNRYTYHHIIKKEEGGELSIENGAILTQKAHALLNFLEFNHPDVYVEWQKIFREINDSLIGPNEEMMGKIKALRHKCLILKKEGNR